MQELVRFDAQAGQTYTVDVRRYNVVYREVSFAEDPIPCWYTDRDHLDFPHLNYTKNSAPWAEARFYSCERLDPNGPGSTATRPKIMGIFNADGGKLKNSKLAGSSPNSKARVQVTAAETGPLFVAVRFVGWWWMFGDYTVEVTQD